MEGKQSCRKVEKRQAGRNGSKMKDKQAGVEVKRKEGNKVGNNKKETMQEAGKQSNPAHNSLNKGADANQ